MTADTGRRSSTPSGRRAPAPMSSSIADSLSVEVRAALQGFSDDEVPVAPRRTTRSGSQPTPSVTQRGPDSRDTRRAEAMRAMHTEPSSRPSSSSNAMTASQRGSVDPSSSPRSTRPTRKRTSAGSHPELPRLLRRIPERVVLDAMTMTDDGRAALVKQLRADMRRLQSGEFPGDLAVSARRTAQWILTEISRMPQRQGLPGDGPRALSPGMRRRRKRLERAIAARTEEVPSRRDEDERIYLPGRRAIYPARGLTTSGGLPTLGRRR